MGGDALEELLVCEGWPINGKQLSNFIGESISKIQDANQLKKQLLDADLREYAVPLLSDRINKQLGEFKGPLVVQVVKQRNVSYPKYNEITHTDGLIKIQLSDGFSSIQALMFEPIPKLNAETPPGTKVCLAGKIPIENGMLLINETNCQVLGGNVEKMIEKWNMEKNWQQKPIRNIESNAPKWTQFSKQRLPQSCLPVNATNEMFRANDIISGLNKKMIDERGDDFSAARKAQIDHVIENNAIKKFARSQLKPKPLENCASTSCNNNSKKDPVIKGKPDTENMDRRSVRDDKKNLLPVHRPSNPPTLYDFMQSKVPMPDGISTGYQNFGNLQFPMEKIETNQQNVETQGMDRPRRGRFNERGFRYQQTDDNTNGSHIFEISNSNRYRKQCNWRLEREKNYATNMVNDKVRVNHADDQLVSTANKELSALHLSSIDNGPLGVGKAHDVPQEIVCFENKNHGYQQNAVHGPVYKQQQQQQRQQQRQQYQQHQQQYQQQYQQQQQRQKQQQQQQQSFDNRMMNGGMLPVWKIGDKCLAPWSDGQFYPSTLVSMGPADMCTIEYDEYGNRSSVPVGVLLPFQTF